MDVEVDCGSRPDGHASHTPGGPTQMPPANRPVGYSPRATMPFSYCFLYARTARKRALAK